MKKIFSALATAMLCGNAAFADDPITGTGTLGPRPGIYKGTRAGDGLFNPCAGRTTRICAVITESPTLGPGNSGEIVGGGGLGLTPNSVSTGQKQYTIILPEDTPYEDYIKMKQQAKLYPNYEVKWLGAEKE